MTFPTDEGGGLEPDRVYSFRYIADLTGQSLPTLRRLIARGEGPPVTQLSIRRAGIRGKHARAWLDSRVRGAA
jgi:predicted DNA-binding transcriptional regulator AlpA